MGGATHTHTHTPHTRTHTHLDIGQNLTRYHDASPSHLSLEVLTASSLCLLRSLRTFCLRFQFLQLLHRCFRSRRHPLLPTPPQDAPSPALSHGPFAKRSHVPNVLRTFAYGLRQSTHQHVSCSCPFGFRLTSCHRIVQVHHLHCQRILRWM